MMVIMFFIWFALLALAVWAIRALFPSLASRTRPQPHDQAMEIVAERYARGEIDQSTYERIRQDLSVAYQDRNL